MACTRCDSEEKACHCETADLRAAVQQLAAAVKTLAWHARLHATCDSGREEIDMVTGAADQVARECR